MHRFIVILLIALTTACAQPAIAPTEETTDPPPPTEASPTTDDEGPTGLTDAPVVPVIGPKAVSLHQAAVAAGRDAQVFTTVGDCMTANEAFLDPIAAGTYDLASYEGLQAVIDYYMEGEVRAVEGAMTTPFDNPSLATACGFNSASPSQAIWSDPELCEGGESPVACEMRVSNAATVFIMLGTHDLYYEQETFEGYMRDIIDAVMDNDALPVLITFPPHLDYPEASRAYNQSILMLGDEYDIPVINLWRALNDLPNQGIAPDEVTKLSLPADGCPTCFTQENLEAGETVHNLVFLQALASLRASTE